MSIKINKNNMYIKDDVSGELIPSGLFGSLADTAPLVGDINEIKEKVDNIDDAIDDLVIVGDKSEATENTKLVVDVTGDEYVDVPTVEELNALSDDITNNVMPNIIHRIGVAANASKKPKEYEYGITIENNNADANGFPVAYSTITTYCMWQTSRIYQTCVGVEGRMYIRYQTYSGESWSTWSELALKSDLTWKTVQSNVASTSSISIANVPVNSEIHVICYVYLSGYTFLFSGTLIKGIDISSADIYIPLGGYGTTTQNAMCYLKANNNSISIDTLRVNGNDIKSNGKFTVIYR